MMKNMRTSSRYKNPETLQVEDTMTPIQARLRRKALRKLIATGIDPSHANRSVRGYRLDNPYASPEALKILMNDCLRFHGR